MIQSLPPGSQQNVSNHLTTDIDQNVLDLWQDCWPGLVQQPRVHWFDQNLIPSHAPKGESPALLDRLNNLAAELHGQDARRV